MRKALYKILTGIQHFLLKREGYVMCANVIISKRGVRKIGGGKIICYDNVNINAETMFIAYKNITIGKNSTLAYRVLITTSANPNSPYNSLTAIYPPVYKEVHIGDNCWIGAGAVILPGVNIGNGSVVAAGSVVTKDVPENVMVAGCPATIKKYLHLADI